MLDGPQFIFDLTEELLSPILGNSTQERPTEHLEPMPHSRLAFQWRRTVE
jgi:hypothetical protein